MNTIFRISLCRFIWSISNSSVERPGISRHQQQDTGKAHSLYFCTLDEVDAAAVDSSLMLADGEASDADRESWRRPAWKTFQVSMDSGKSVY